ncbi:MAG: hypothetical protein A2583_05580 [Bdellovibrionales bacterium RIFOXYD1_FULL_53_11]|nr:MAG: hypothetical protein A2583_05580 [Bdellovibrionales bacterium RIFOXYD1_FULL_53_11]
MIQKLYQRLSELISLTFRHPGHLVWILAAYIPFLGLYSVPLTGDQKVYLNTALEMRERGSFLVPYLFGAPSYYKPPLHYWITMGSWKIFGFNLWGSLIPSVIATIATAWFIGAISNILHARHGRRWFSTAGAWFALALGTVTFGTTAQMEIFTCLFYAAAWWAALKFLAGPAQKRRWLWLYGAFAIAGLAAINKSPLYSVLWVAGFFSYVLFEGHWDLLRERRFYLAWLFGIAVGSVWYGSILIVDGQRFLTDYLVRETWNKRSGNRGSWWSLWLALLYYCVPFTLMLLPSMRAIRRGRAWGLVRFLFCWCWAPALFFTIYPYRVKAYFHMLVPAAALIVEWGYYHFSGKATFRWATAVTGFLVFVALEGSALVLQRAWLVPAWIVTLFVLTGATVFLFATRSWMRAFMLACFAGILVFRIAAVSLGQQDIAGLRASVASLPGHTRIGMYDEHQNIWHEFALMSVALARADGTPPIERLDSLDKAVKLLRTGGLLILSDEQDARLGRTLLAKYLGTGDRRELEDKPWPRWKSRIKFPYQKLLRGELGKRSEILGMLQRNFRLKRVAN